MTALHGPFLFVCLVTWFILTSQYADGYKTCYSCQRIPFPRDCSHVTKCSESENCVTQQYVSDSGHVWYDSGCVTKQRCMTSSRNMRSVVGSEDSGDIVTCVECCEGELCNSHGCNSVALPDRNVRGPVCFTCNQQQYADTCETVSICQHSEVCYLEFGLTSVTHDPIYSSGCVKREQCDSINSPGNSVGSTCTGCCDNDYCNRNCSAVGAIDPSKPVTSISPSYSTTPSTPTTFSTTLPSVISTTAATMLTAEDFCKKAHYTYNDTLGICYRLYTNISLPWQQSRDACRWDGGDLIVYHSLNEELFFEAITKAVLGSHPKEARFWVGGTDVLTEMNFLWLDGESVSSTYFHPNEPNNAYDNEDCLATTLFENAARRVLLNDDDCNLKSHFICELDMKGLQDTHSPHVAQHGPCRNGDYTYSPEVNLCYKVFKDRLTMTEARTRCSGDEADLLILRDLQEELYFQGLPFHDTNNDHRYWVGGARTPADTFEWFDGSQLKSSLRWFAGEPNNYEKNESCLSMTYFDGNREEFYLNDDNCAKHLFYICEEKCPDTSYRYIPSLDLCYKIYNENVTWPEARDRCHGDKATLAEVDTMAKLAYFQVVLNDQAHDGGHKYWVGANISTDGDFHWLTTGHVVAKELWHITEPSAGESCVALHWYPLQYGNAFKLNNRSCGIQDRYICQYIRGV